MSVLVAVLTLMLLAAVMVVVSRPLLVGRKPEEPGAPERSELEAEREAKYREIRDAELDYRTGKLSREDYEAVNGALRAEAVEILNRLESSEEEDEDDEEDEDEDEKDADDEEDEEEEAADAAK
ncbi:MAG TPA: hypothetical protein VNU28_05725 [Solirubrobacteraceae bacterium]|jgi:hypothetical protein|nr:hypothetical protein [Solirubrobacteraceae bacterium]